ncbi:MAG: glycoside hydrolase domain-containing protein, partial [Lactococcus raffinolactis]
LGIPLFDKATLYLSNGQELIITANQTAEQYQFVDEVELNGQVSTSLVLKHDDIMQGKDIAFKLSLVPIIKEVAADDLPTSLTQK